MTAAYLEKQGTEQEERSQEYDNISERMAGVEGQRRVLVGVVRDNGRRSDALHQAIDAKIDGNYKSHNGKFESVHAKIASCHKGMKV